jgi:hypothetical protein
MSPLIQDASDPHVRMIGVGDRFAFDAGTQGKIIWTRLPDDFGKPVYGVRRAAAIKDHLRTVIGEPDQLRRLFDVWLGPSEDLRQYLWGHPSEQIQVARQLIDILPFGSILEMLRYLVEDYWARRSGWPDLLIFNEKEFFSPKSSLRGTSWKRTSNVGFVITRKGCNFLLSWSKSAEWNIKPRLALDGGCSCSAPLLSVAYPASGNEVVHRPTAPSRATKRAAEIRSRWSSTAFLTAAIHLRRRWGRHVHRVSDKAVNARCSTVWRTSRR